MLIPRLSLRPDLLSRIVMVAAISVIIGAVCGCAGRPARAVAAGGSEKNSAPAFAGSAARISPPSECGNIVPARMAHPFTPAGGRLTVKNYQIVECWGGKLAGKSFRLATYFSPTVGAGLAIWYSGALRAHLQAGSGPPRIVRFTGNDVCIAEKAGAYFEAANIRTGARMDERHAQDICPPDAWPPAHVLGLQTGQRSDH